MFGPLRPSTPAASCLRAALVVFGSFAMATAFWVSDSTSPFTRPPLIVTNLPMGGGSGRGPPKPIPGGGPPRPAAGRGLAFDDADEVGRRERRVDEVERRHELLRRVGRAHRERGVEAVGQVYAVARQRLVEIRDAVGHHRGRQRRVLLVFGVGHQFAVEVVGRVPRVLVDVVDLLAVRPGACRGRREVQRRDAEHLERRRVRAAWRGRVGARQGLGQLERPLRVQSRQRRRDGLQVVRTRSPARSRR